MSAQGLEGFWGRARRVVPGLPSRVPEAWAFGAGPAEADELLGLVLAGLKTATSSAASDYAAAGEDLPAAGDLAIVLDGAARPRALIETTSVTVVRFDRVGAAHAWCEGEGERTLSAWRREHEAFWREHAAGGFSLGMRVVCEQFRLRFPLPPGDG